nr:MAG TPA: hypothetical protein [Bacteriophage sp.]
MSPTDLAPVGTDLGSTLAILAGILLGILIYYAIWGLGLLLKRLAPKHQPRHAYGKPTEIYDWKEQGL